MVNMLASPMVKIVNFCIIKNKVSEIFKLLVIASIIKLNNGEVHNRYIIKTRMRSDKFKSILAKKDLKYNRNPDPKP